MGMLRDHQNFPLTGATESALAHYERANRELRCFIGDPVGSVEAAIAEAPDFVMASCLQGLSLRPLHGTCRGDGGAPVPRDRVGHRRNRARGGPCRPRSATWRMAAGMRPARCLPTSPPGNPLDVLGLQTGHQIDFFTGNAAMLRDRIDRALPFWSPTVDGHHALLAMAAFGHEEMGDYGRAEALGRGAPLNSSRATAGRSMRWPMSWRCRAASATASPGCATMSDAWAKESFLQVHNWWHLALFHYELGEIDEVLALYDGPIYGDRSTLALNMLDASAILWRLHLGGVDVGDRWDVHLPTTGCRLHATATTPSTTSTP